MPKNTGYSRVHDYAINGDVDGLDRYLKTLSTDNDIKKCIDIKKCYGEESSLYIASERGHTKVVSLLISKGAELESYNWVS